MKKTDVVLRAAVSDDVRNGFAIMEESRDGHGWETHSGAGA